jgi:DNA-binding MarR family transcriptional regulator
MQVRTLFRRRFLRRSSLYLPRCLILKPPSCTFGRDNVSISSVEDISQDTNTLCQVLSGRMGMRGRNSHKRTSISDRRRSEGLEAAQTTKTTTVRENLEQWKRARPDLNLTAVIFAIPTLRLGKIVEDHWDQQCVKHFGLRSNDMRVLLALRRIGPPYAKRPTDLFQSLLVTSGAVTKQVDRLARKKLVKRMGDPNHGGGCLVHLTPQGLRVSNKAMEMNAEEGPLHDALLQMPLRERKVGLEFLVKLLTLMGQ